MIGTQCIHLNIPAALLIIVSVFFNGIRFSDTGRVNAILEKLFPFDHMSSLFSSH